MTDAAVGETCEAPENGPCFVMGRRRSGRPPFVMGRRRGLRVIAFLKERESMMVRERIEALRERMRREGMDAYMVPTADFHGSEYVGAHFKCREYLSGFTGSAGTLVVTGTEAGLWVDGRYFVQAEAQLAGSPVRLYRMGMENVPSIREFLLDRLPEGGVLGFDGRTVSAGEAQGLEEGLSEKRIRLAVSKDLVDEIWEGRPPLSENRVWVLGERYAGRSASDKLQSVRAAMRESGADLHVITALDDIAWILNIRGSDVRCNPVALAYLAVSEEACILFTGLGEEEPRGGFGNLTEEAAAHLASLSVEVKPYHGVYRFAREVSGKTVLMEAKKVNCALYTAFAAANRIVEGVTPASRMKAVKNFVEAENLRRAHVKDGVAVTRFMYWMKKNAGKIPMDEITASDYLDGLRKEQGCLDLSFPTISAYREHGAICHYMATEESKKPICAEGLYLVDSGGQYLEGTTDVTRTFALGPLSDEERELFTAVAVGMLRLADAKFLYGCRGRNLDYIAREELWRRGLDFNHGTGHGVGYLLNVHERPNGFGWRDMPGKDDNAVLEEGMVTSDEPGIYLEGRFGVRIENLLLCVKREKNGYGQFMGFESLTCVPIDLDAIDPAVMTERDVELLNRYHRKVYETLEPYFAGEEREWLREYTREIGKQ